MIDLAQIERDRAILSQVVLVIEEPDVVATAWTCRLLRGDTRPPSSDFMVEDGGYPYSCNAVRAEAWNMGL